MKRKDLYIVMAISWVLVVGLTFYNADVFKSEEIKPFTELSEIIKYRAGYTDQSREYFIKHEAMGAYRLIKVFQAHTMQTEGVIAVHPEYYKATIQISECYEWNEVEDNVLEAIESHIKTYNEYKEKAKAEGKTEKEKI